MEIYKVTIMPQARDSMVGIGEYIKDELQNPAAAEKLLKEMLEMIVSLDRMPKRFPLIQSERLERYQLRNIPINNYIIYYIINDSINKVSVIDVLYAGRNQEKALEDTVINITD